MRKEGGKDRGKDNSHSEKVPDLGWGRCDLTLSAERRREGQVLWGRNTHYENFLNDCKS